MRMNRTQMADCLNVAPTTLDAWTREGCPVEHRPGQGKAAEFDSGEVIRWWIDRETAKAAKRADGADLDALRAEKIAVETRLKQLEFCRESGLVAPLAEIERAVTAWSVELRQNLRLLPQRLEPMLIGETDPILFKTKMLAEIDQVLTGLADSDLLTGTEFEGLADED